jgi:antiviral helicase SLH1
VPTVNHVTFAWLTRSRHLPVSSTFSSLIGLLSSSRSNEEIQSELVEILGFEGEGLQLVEELLRPGARDRVVQESGLVNGKVSDPSAYLLCS